ncbi:MAG: ABC transporter substrate-binding protein [Candidatus Limnocylindrales bacterium]
MTQKSQWKKEGQCMKRRFITIAVTALVVAAACGGSAGPTGQPSPSVAPAGTAAAAATKPPRATVKVQVGSAASLLYLSWDLAKALGYFEEENLDVQLTYASAGTAAATALLSGSVEFTGNSLDHSIKAQLQGKPTKMVVSFAKDPGVALVVANSQKDKIKTIADLKGQKVGATGEGSGTHLLLVYALLKAGLKEGDYTFVACGSGTMAATLDSGGAVACMNSDPFVTAFVGAGKGFVLKDYRSEKDTKELLGGDYQFTGAVTTQEFIQKSPDVVQRVVNALVRANRFLAATPPKDVAAKLPESVTGKDIELYIKTLEAAKGYLSADGIIDQKGVDNVLVVNVEDCKANSKLCGNVKPTDQVDSKALFDNTFAARVKK